MLKVSIRSGACATLRGLLFASEPHRISVEFMSMRRIAIGLLILAIAAALLAAPVDVALARQLKASALALVNSAQAGAQPNFAHKLAVEGLPQLGEVTPILYRGSQPKKEGFEQLAKMHVGIVVDLRGNREGERETVTKLGMRYVPIPWFCMRPKNAIVAEFLNLLRDNPDKKVFVHCNTGIDRTGMMVAAYRMAKQGWTTEEAMAEMKAFGFSRFHETICLGLSSYEKNFPHEFASDPVFKSLRASRPSYPALGEQPRR